MIYRTLGRTALDVSVPHRPPGYEPDIFGFWNFLAYRHLPVNTLSHRVLL